MDNRRITRKSVDRSGHSIQLAQQINAPRFKVALIVENNAPSQYGVFDMADRTTFNGRLVARYSTDYHAEQYARALELNHAEVQS